MTLVEIAADVSPGKQKLCCDVTVLVGLWSQIRIPDLPHQCGIRDFRRFISISHTVTGRSFTKLWEMTDADKINTLHFGSDPALMGSGLIRQSGLESRITFGWNLALAEVCAVVFVHSLRVWRWHWHCAVRYVVNQQAATRLNVITRRHLHTTTLTGLRRPYRTIALSLWPTDGLHVHAHREYR